MPQPLPETTPAAMHDYDYAVMRLVPDVRAEAFVNVGVALHSRTARFCAFRVRLPESGGFGGVDAEVLRRFCDGLARTLDGAPEGGPLALHTPSERFHWLTAARSTVVQFSPVRGGTTDNLPATFEALLEAYLRV